MSTNMAKMTIKIKNKIENRVDISEGFLKSHLRKSEFRKKPFKNEIKKIKRRN
jgi:hypothetical protein